MLAWSSDSSECVRRLLEGAWSIALLWSHNHMLPDRSIVVEIFRCCTRYVQCGWPTIFLFILKQFIRLRVLLTTSNIMAMCILLSEKKKKERNKSIRSLRNTTSIPNNKKIGSSIPKHLIFRNQGCRRAIYYYMDLQYILLYGFYLHFDYKWWWKKLLASLKF
jgi:hypothetical protein